ncbi:hypothetical protein, partial [Microbacterium petrolearium]
ALVGDAAYAPSFLTGQGSSLALVGAAVLTLMRWRVEPDAYSAPPTETWMIPSDSASAKP